MIYYIILAILFCVSITFYFTDDKVNKVIVYCFLIAFLIFFAGIRYDTGFDYQNYLRIYETVKFEGYSLEVEPSVSFIMNICTGLNMSYGIFLFFVAMCAIGLKARFFWQYSLYPFLSLSLYFARSFLTSDFGQIRQGVACAIVLYSFLYISERNFKRYSLLLLVASSIHVASLLFYPVYFIAHKKIKLKFLVALLVICLPFPMLDLKSIAMNYLTSFMPEYIAQKLLYYGDNESEVVIGLTYSLFLRLFLIIVLLSSHISKVYQDNKSLVAFNIYYWGVIFYLIFNSLPQIGIRGSLYFQQFELLLFPYLLSYYTHVRYRILIYTFIMFYCYWGVWSTLKSQTDAFIPYKSVLGD